MVINNEASALKKLFKTSLPAGVYCDVISDDVRSGCHGHSVTVGPGGEASVEVQPFAALALHVEARL